MLVLTSDCVREERQLVCLHVVLENNVGLLVLASEGSCELTGVVRYIERNVVIWRHSVFVEVLANPISLSSLSC